MNALVRTARDPDAVVWRPRVLIKHRAPARKGRDLQERADAHVIEWHRYHATLDRWPSTLRRLLGEVCRECAVAPIDVLGSSRKAPLVRARQIVMWRLRSSTKRSLSQIGYLFGRDHTTVLHAIRKVERGAMV